MKLRYLEISVLKFKWLTWIVKNENFTIFTTGQYTWLGMYNKHMAVLPWPIVLHNRWNTLEKQSGKTVIVQTIWVSLINNVFSFSYHEQNPQTWLFMSSYADENWLFSSAKSRALSSNLFGKSRLNKNQPPQTRRSTRPSAIALFPSSWSYTPRQENYH